MNRFETVLTKTQPAGPDARVLFFKVPSLEQAPTPGQFFMVKLLEGEFPLFGRAFAVLNYSSGVSEGEVGFLVKAVGRGTHRLCMAEPGLRALLVGPAGRGFPPIENRANTLFVAGGTGVAAFHYLLQSLEISGKKPTAPPLLLYGARNKISLYLLEGLERLPVRIKVSTEDGSAGIEGLVTALLDEELGSPDLARDTVVYACGPDLMMKAAAERCIARGVRILLSLEGRMACGIGVCNGCVVEVMRDGKKSFERVCHEGPVFDARDLPFFA